MFANCLGMQKGNESIVELNTQSSNWTWCTSELAVCQMVFERKIRTITTSTCSFPSVLLVTCRNHSIRKPRDVSLIGSSLFSPSTLPWLSMGRAWMGSIIASLFPKHIMKYLDKISPICVRILKKKNHKHHKNTTRKILLSQDFLHR